MHGRFLQHGQHMVFSEVERNPVNLFSRNNPSVSLKPLSCMEIHKAAFGQIDMMHLLIEHRSYQQGFSQHVLCGQASHVQVLRVFQYHGPHHGKSFRAGFAGGAVQIRRHAVSELIDFQEGVLGFPGVEPGFPGCWLSMASAQRRHQSHLHGADVFLIPRDGSPAFVVTVVEASDIKAPEGHAAESHAESSP